MEPNLGMLNAVKLAGRWSATQHWREAYDVQIQPYTTNIKIGGGIICGTMSDAPT